MNFNLASSENPKALWKLPNPSRSNKRCGQVAWDWSRTQDPTPFVIGDYTKKDKITPKRRKVASLYCSLGTLEKAVFQRNFFLPISTSMASRASHISLASASALPIFSVE